MILSAFKYWWLVALKGLSSLLLGLIVLLYPVKSAEAFLIYLGILIGLGGLFMVIFGWRNGERATKKWFIAEGIFDIVIAGLIIGYPEKTAIILALLFGIWLLFNALFRFNIYRRRKLVGKDFEMPLLNAILTLIFSMLLLSNPMTGVMAFAYLLGFSAVIFGALLITTSLRWWRHEVKFRKKLNT